jgi:hypothetical protein
MIAERAGCSVAAAGLTLVMGMVIAMAMAVPFTDTLTMTAIHSVTLACMAGMAAVDMMGLVALVGISMFRSAVTAVVTVVDLEEVGTSNS